MILSFFVLKKFVNLKLLFNFVFIKFSLLLVYYLWAQLTWEENNIPQNAQKIINDICGGLLFISWIIALWRGKVRKMLLALLLIANHLNKYLCYKAMCNVPWKDNRWNMFLYKYLCVRCNNSPVPHHLPQHSIINNTNNIR